MLARMPQYEWKDDEPVALPENLGDLVVRAASVAAQGVLDREEEGRLSPETDQAISRTINPLLRAYQQAQVPWVDFHANARLEAFRIWWGRWLERLYHDRVMPPVDDADIEATMFKCIDLALGLTKFHVDREARRETPAELALRLQFMSKKERRAFVGKYFDLWN